MAIPFLSSLPQASRERLQDLGQSVRLEVGQVLVHHGNRIEQVYFPYRGIVSVVVLMKDGRSADAATIGFEGMVGVSLVLGVERTPWDVMVQVEGQALQIPASVFQRVLAEDEALRKVLLRYVEVRLVQATRAAACNRLHDVGERLARWLLHAHDWVWGDSFRLTQDFLGAMLGVRRSTVTVAAGALQRAGLITYRRGEITILDRRGLEEIACEDYTAIREAFEGLLALPPQDTGAVNTA